MGIPTLPLILPSFESSKLCWSSFDLVSFDLVAVSNTVSRCHCQIVKVSIQPSPEVRSFRFPLVDLLPPWLALWSLKSVRRVYLRQWCGYLSISEMTLGLGWSGICDPRLSPTSSCSALPHALRSHSCPSRLIQWHLMVSKPGPSPSGLRSLSCGQNLSSEDGDRIRYRMVLSVGASLNVSCHLIADRHSSSATQDSRRQEVSWGQGVCFIYWFGKIFSLPGTGMCIPCAWSHEIWQVPYQMPKTVIQLRLI